MQQASSEVQAHEKPLWRRIVDFPLVALLIALAVIRLGSEVVHALAGLATPPIPGLTPQIWSGLIAVVVLCLLYVLVIARLGEHPRNDFRDPKALRHLLLGLVGGTVLFSVAVLIAAVMGIYRIVGLGDLSGMLSALILAALVPAVLEEMIFRGILFRWLEEFGGSWTALLLTSALFGAAHLGNPNASLIAAVGIAFEAGVMLGAAYMLTRSLWLPMGIHAAWNFTQGEVYDIPVSGTAVHGMLDGKLTGSPLLTGNGFGLEASPIAIGVATAAGIWLVYLSVRKGHLVQPWWVRRRALSAR